MTDRSGRSNLPDISRRTLCIAALSAVLLLMVSPAAMAESAQPYYLGPEDAIQVTVLRHPELSGEYLIPNDGAISLPRVGQLQVTGKTLAETEAAVVSRLKNTLLDPEVSVTLKNPRRQLVYVMGAVQRPGPYDVKPGWRLTEALTAAGGVPSDTEPADCRITILAAGTGVKSAVPLLDVIRGDAASNKVLRSGDVLTVEAIELMPIYVMGRVNRPGVYNLRKSSNGILEAIAVAGGTRDGAALTKVTVTHLNGESETASIVPATLEGKQESPIKLQSGDLVVVPDSTARFAVLGWVNSPGFFPMQENQQIMLSDALAMAHGVENRRGGIRQIAILRETGGKVERTTVDFGKFSRKGDMTQNPLIKQGDIVWVPETGSPDWDRILSRLSSSLALLLAVQ